MRRIDNSNHKRASKENPTNTKTIIIQCQMGEGQMGDKRYKVKKDICSRKSYCPTISLVCTFENMMERDLSSLGLKE